MTTSAAIDLDDFAWYPHHGPQMEFCQAGEFEVLFGGAAGPGKTDCLIMVAARNVDHPRYHGLILRRTFPQLQEIIDRCFHWYPLIDPGSYYKATEHRWYFSSGARITLGHMQHENDKYNYQGKEFHFIGFDELTQFTADQYLYLFSRARSTDPDLPPKVRSTTNPGGVGHAFCKERFVDVADPGTPYVDSRTGLSRRFIPATIFDNPTLIENDPAYLARLDALPETERKRLRDGSWDAFAGQAFPELNMAKHACDPFEVPPEWEHWMAFDWGYSAPWAALWFAKDFDDNVYLYRELYGARKTEQGTWAGKRQTNIEMCRDIFEVEREKMHFRVADPACWAPTKMNGKNTILGPSFVEDAGKEGLFFLKADNDRIRGRSQCHQRLAMREETDKSTGEVTETPNFMAFRTCTHFWRTIPLMQESPRNPEDIDTDTEDHIYDTWRYGLMARPIIPQRVHTIPPGSFKAERNRLINAKRYAKRHGVSLEMAYARLR